MPTTALSIALALMSFSGGTCHSTSANEVGVLTRKVAPFGKKGVQDEVARSSRSSMHASPR